MHQHGGRCCLSAVTYSFPNFLSFACKPMLKRLAFALLGAEFISENQAQELGWVSFKSEALWTCLDKD